MVVDRHRVKLGRWVEDGALTVVEQIPGLVEYSDQSQALRRGLPTPTAMTTPTTMTTPSTMTTPTTTPIVSPAKTAAYSKV